MLEANSAWATAPKAERQTLPDTAGFELTLLHSPGKDSCLAGRILDTVGAGTISPASVQPGCGGPAQGPSAGQGHGAQKCCRDAELLRKDLPAMLRWVWLPPSQSMGF